MTDSTNHTDELKELCPDLDRDEIVKLINWRDAAVITELEAIPQCIDGCNGYADAEHINDRLATLKSKDGE